MAEQTTTLQPIAIFPPWQQQILQNFSAIMAIATLIGGVFVNVFILNTLRADVDTLKKESAKQSRSLAIIMDRLGIKEVTSAAQQTQSHLADRVPAINTQQDEDSDASGQLQTNVTIQAPQQQQEITPTQTPAPTPTPTPGRRPIIETPGPPLNILPSQVPTIHIPQLPNPLK